MCKSIKFTETNKAIQHFVIYFTDYFEIYLMRQVVICFWLKVESFVNLYDKMIGTVDLKLPVTLFNFFVRHENNNAM